jgi:hypothetical protein
MSVIACLQHLRTATRKSRLTGCIAFAFSSLYFEIVEGARRGRLADPSSTGVVHVGGGTSADLDDAIFSVVGISVDAVVQQISCRVMRQSQRQISGSPSGQRRESSFLLAGSLSQLRRNLVRLLELRAGFRRLPCLMKGQCKIVVRFRIAWLEANRFCKLRLSFGVSASLQ